MKADLLAKGGGMTPTLLYTLWNLAEERKIF